MKDWRPNLDSDDKDSGRNNDININDDSPPGDSQTGEQGNEDANMTGAPDSQTKSNDNDIAHQLAGQEFRMEEYPQINNTIGYNTYDPEGDTLDDDDCLDYSRAAGTGSPHPSLLHRRLHPNMRAVSQSPTMMDSRTLTPGLLGIQTMLQLMSTQRLRTRIAALSGVEPENVDCCLNVCHAFTGQYAKEDVCLKCNEPRYDYKGRPRKTFQYLPATPRFRAYFNNPDFIRKMLYHLILFTARVQTLKCLVVSVLLLAVTTRGGKRTIYLWPSRFARTLLPFNRTMLIASPSNQQKTAAQTRRIMETARVGLADDLRKKYGTKTVGATNLIPAKFIRPFPNIESSRHLYTSELWSFWLIYIGPVVLRGRLPQKYYSHYLKFVQILKCLLQLENTTRRIKQLKEEVIEYVEEFEEYYYQYDYDRLSVCQLTLHALLHIADDVLRCGPVWVAWSFSIKRYCREIVGCAKSKVVPYAAIDRHVLQMAQLAATALYAVLDPKTILRKPRLPGFPLTGVDIPRLADFVPTHANAGKTPDSNGGNYIRCAAVVNPLLPYGRRDSSFIWYEFEMDANKNYPNRDIKMVKAFGYGRLDFIIALTLPPSRKFKLDDPKLHILAHVTKAKGAEGNARTEPVSFTQLGRLVILDVSSVKHVVRRVYTTGVKRSGEWYIIDRSLGVCETAFCPAEQVYEDED
ncbi:hypothetical protein RHS01_10234 [Rhizoctonia solani]|uniref:Uncharacterized protein n=1 Tax=Rhizoctonia solani TaxID=456999 RepID=A0A8H7I220_9AGAM|nr:hypothetical protein RHS01_10234 [Rhizoctonia solani]